MKRFGPESVTLRSETSSAEGVNVCLVSGMGLVHEKLLTEMTPEPRGRLALLRAGQSGRIVDRIKVRGGRPSSDSIIYIGPVREVP